MTAPDPGGPIADALAAEFPLLATAEGSDSTAGEVVTASMFVARVRPEGAPRPKLVITRGLPASGKTGWARAQPLWRVNRDSIRAMLHLPWDHDNQAHEDLVTAMQDAMIGVLLDAGIDTVADDTNLRPGPADRLRALAARHDADFEVKDFTDVTPEVCAERDAGRPEAEQVGPGVIWDMWRRYLAPPAAAVGEGGQG